LFHLTTIRTFFSIIQVARLPSNLFFVVPHGGLQLSDPPNPTKLDVSPAEQTFI